MRPLAAGLTGLFLSLVALPATAHAAPKWRLDPDQTLAYKVRLAPLEKAGELPLAIPEDQWLRARDIAAWRLRSDKSETLGAFVVRAALDVEDPRAAGLSKLKTDAPFALDLEGQRAVRAKTEGATTTIEGRITGAAWSLSWTTVFDEARGRVKEARFRFALDYQAQGAPRPYPYRCAGTIRFVEALKQPGIEEAIQRGRRYLEPIIAISVRGQYRGELALYLFALLRSGADPKSPTIVEGFRALEKMPINTGLYKQSAVYSAAFSIMAWEALSVKRLAPSSTTTAPRYELGRPDDRAKARIKALADWLIAARAAGQGRWGYSSLKDQKTMVDKLPTQRADYYDNSNTQIAVLALHAAERSGVKVPPVVWREVLEHFKLCQYPAKGRGRHRFGFAEKDPLLPVTRERKGTKARASVAAPYRGWSYQGPGGLSLGPVFGSTYGSMTAAGLSSLAIAAHSLERAGKLRKPELRDFQRMTYEGLAWLAKHYSLDKNPGMVDQEFYYYYLYSIEKAFDHLELETLDGHNWYDEGARRLIERQSVDGGWTELGPNSQPLSKAYTTAFALLFLNRASLRTVVKNSPRRRVATGAEEERDRVAVAEGEAPVSLRAELEALLSAPRRERRRLRKRLAAGVERLAEQDRPVLIPGLVKALSEKELRAFALKQLRLITAERRLKGAGQFEDWHGRWRAMDRAHRDLAYKRIPLLRQSLEAGKRRPVLARAALLAAPRLMAVELAQAIVPLLEEKAFAVLARAALRDLTGLAEPAPASVEAWVKDRGSAAIKAQEPRRRAAAAALGDAEARRALLEAPKAHRPWLVAIAEHPEAGPRARAMLTKITGEEPRSWSRWLQEHGEGPGIEAILAPLKAGLAGEGAEAARAEILALGRRAIPSLLGWLEDSALALEARRILGTMTGARVGDWRAWWAVNKARVDDRGRLEGAPPQRTS